MAMIGELWVTNIVVSMSDCPAFVKIDLFDLAHHLIFYLGQRTTNSALHCQHTRRWWRHELWPNRIFDRFLNNAIDLPHGRFVQMPVHHLGNRL